ELAHAFELVEAGLFSSEYGHQLRRGFGSLDSEPHRRDQGLLHTQAILFHWIERAPPIDAGKRLVVELDAERYQARVSSKCLLERSLGRLGIPFCGRVAKLMFGCDLRRFSAHARLHGASQFLIELQGLVQATSDLRHEKA